MGLTEAQREQIEQNRQKALKKRQEAIKKQQVSFSPIAAKCLVQPEPQTTAERRSSGGALRATAARPSPSLGRSSAKSSGQCVLESRDRFRVEMGYHSQIVELFKGMPSAKYNANLRQWTFSLDQHEHLMRTLRPFRPDVVIDPLPRFVVNALDKSRLSSLLVPVRINEPGQEDCSFSVEPGLWDSLMPFQREGVVYALQRKGRILLADDMGLGKTIQALAICHAFYSEWPLLVVCPSSMRFSWKVSVLKWLPRIVDQDVLVVTSGRDYLCQVKVLIISYDLLPKKEKELQERRVQVVVFDECHFLKSHKSQRCKSAEAISKNAKRILLLSGTPALSRPIELFSQICLVEPQLFPFATDFGMRYCDGRVISIPGRKDHYDFSGASNMNELRIILETRCMIRRLKCDVISQLPAKQRQMIVLNPSLICNKNAQMKSQASQMMSQSLSKAEKRGLLLQFFHSTANAKVKAVLEYLQDLVDCDKKFLCFAHHQIMLQAIAHFLEDKKVGFIRIDGATSSSARQDFCTRFQTQDSIRVALLSITAANAGITLTAAQLVVFAELFWNPGILVQAEDRVHRIGQTSSVTVKYLVATGTADDQLWPMIQKKLDVLSKVGLSKENFLESDTQNVHQASSASSADKNDQAATPEEWMLSDSEINDLFMEPFDSPSSSPDAKRIRK